MTVMITQAKSDPSELGRDGLLALAIILGEAHDLGHAIRAEEGDAGDPLEDATACEGVDGAMRDMLDAMKPADA
jgi:hypothetical protein